MSFRKFVDEASSLTREACVSLGYVVPENLEWEIPPSKDFGDVSFRVGYQLAKSARKRPGEIADSIASKIESDLAREKKFVQSARGHPSGFLNFHFNPSTLFSEVLISASSPSYGSIDVGEDRAVLVEHTSVNPNKALHIGHLRNVALGDSMGRIFKFTNHRVSILNYIDDSGLQVADVIVGLKYLGYSTEAPPGKKFDHYAGDDVYVSVNRKYETEPSLKEKQRLVLKAIEEHDQEIFPFAAEITRRILQEQLRTCWRFNAFYDLFIYESDIIASRLWEDVFNELKSNGIATLEASGKLAGCWIVRVAGEKEGEEKVLVRSDGTATYVAKDIPFAALKTGLIKDKFSYEEFVDQPNGKIIYRSNSTGRGGENPGVQWGSKSVTVIDSRQGRLQRVILHILSQLASKDLADRYIFLGYSIVSLSPRTAASLHVGDSASEEIAGNEEDLGVVTMSGRKGTYINADDLFDQLQQKALEETKKRNEGVMDENWLRNVSETIAISAVRFSLLKQDLDKMIIFDLDESLKLVGETGPYMLYSFARATSILSKLQGTKPEARVNAGLLSSETEIELLTTISKFDISVEKAVKMLAPKWIAHYSFELCEAFNKFYEKNRVLQVEDQALREARIALVSSFANVLKTALGLLGIEVLPKI